MASIYQNLEDIKEGLDNTVSTVPRFGYKSAALLNDAGIAGHNTYSDNNDNNVPTSEGTYLTNQEREKGFRDTLNTLSREMFTHFFGRVSYNFNKLRSFLSNFIDTYKKDYAHNFREYDKSIAYDTGDVCFIVVQGIRYCFVSLDDSNTDEIVYNDDGTFGYDDTKWRLLQERRAVTHSVGEPFMWFGADIPSGHICFNDGATYSWNDQIHNFSALYENEDFKRLIAFWSPMGASYNKDTGFKVPSINERYHLSRPVGDVVAAVGAVVPDHTHPAASVVATQGTSASGHAHILNYANNGHEHYAGWLCDGYNTYPPYNYMGFLPTSSVIDYGSKRKYMDQDDNNRFRYNRALETTSTTNSITMGSHTAVTVPNRTLSHTHTVTAVSGAWSTPAGKYRPGTVAGRLIIRYM